MSAKRSVSVLVGIARDEIDHGYHLDGVEPEEYVGQVIFTIEAGDLPEIADDWARQQNEYVYTSVHFDMEADYRYTDEWQAAQRSAAETVGAQWGTVYLAAPDGKSMLLQLVSRLRAETIAVFLADVYTTAVWDWLHLVANNSPTARNYLDEQAELALAGARDVPYLD